MHDSASTMSPSGISPVLSISVNFHTCVPEPMSWPLHLPLSIGPPDTPIVGTLMQFVRQKDPELWIEVATEVAAAKPDTRFLLGGYGEMESIVTARIKALGLAERVILVKQEVGWRVIDYRIY